MLSLLLYESIYFGVCPASWQTDMMVPGAWCLRTDVGLHACRIHKRLIDLHSPADVVKQITSIK